MPCGAHHECLLSALTAALQIATSTVEAVALKTCDPFEYDTVHWPWSSCCEPWVVTEKPMLVICASTWAASDLDFEYGRGGTWHCRSSHQPYFSAPQRAQMTTSRLGVSASSNPT